MRCVLLYSRDGVSGSVGLLATTLLWVKRICGQERIYRRERERGGGGRREGGRERR